MPNINTSQTETSTEQEWTPLETGEYIMAIGAAQIAPSKFANADGEHEEQFRVRWDLAEWRDEWEDSGYVRKQSVFQQMQPWYGTGKKGDSKFKTFIDGLKDEGLISDDVWIAGPDDADNQGDLIGTKRRVMVERYKKTMGPNAGDWGNRVMAVTSLKPRPAKPATPPPPAVPRKTAVADTNGKKTTYRTPVPPPEYFTQLIEEANDPDLSVEQLREIVQDFVSYAGGFWLTKSLDVNADELRNNLKRMVSMIDRNRAESRPLDDLKF